MKCVLIALFIDAPLILLNGWALSILWAWFAVPIFHLPPLGIAGAIGTAIIVGMLTAKTPGPDVMAEDWLDRLARVVAFNLTHPLFALAAGWIVKGFM